VTPFARAEFGASHVVFFPQFCVLSLPMLQHSLRLTSPWALWDISHQQNEFVWNAAVCVQQHISLRFES
jgi:hypothetical protein